VKVALFDLNEPPAKPWPRNSAACSAWSTSPQEDSGRCRLRQGARGHRPGAHPGQLRRHRQCHQDRQPRQDHGEIKAFPAANFERIIQINLIGTFRCIAKSAAGMLTLPPLADGERGAIVNTASVAAQDGQMGQASLLGQQGRRGRHDAADRARPDGRGIRVNTILPGIFNTPLLQGAPENVKQALAASVPFPKRLGDPTSTRAGRDDDHQRLLQRRESVRIDGAIRMASYRRIVDGEVLRIGEHDSGA
jgi:NAD(P)-dependent dehydrogenase (short-subunit alcohol dehydrogenase family)